MGSEDEDAGTRRLVGVIRESGNVLLVAGLTAFIVWLTFQIPIAAGFFLVCGGGFVILARVLEKMFLGAK